MERLSSPGVLVAEHAEVEELLRVEGREVLRRLFEDHMALRAPAQATRGEVVGSDGVVRRRRRVGMGRALTTIFGTVGVQRVGYRAHEGAVLAPLDAAVNLPPDRYSHGVRAEVARRVVKGSFEDASEELKRSTGAPVPKRQVEELTHTLARDFDAYYDQRSVTPVREEATLLVLSFDGTGVHMRPEALREQTRTLREAMPREDRWPSPTRTGPSRNNGTRSAAVSVCYELEPCPRDLRDILRDLRGLEAVESAQRRVRSRPEAKRGTASLERPMRQVVAEALADALRRDPDRRKRWVVLVDGIEHQLELVRARARAVEDTILVDLIHVAGYTWAAAKELRPDDFSDQRRLVLDKLTELLWGNACRTAGAWRRAATMRKLSARERAPVDACAAYLTKFGAYLTYDEALADGLSITTSVVEGTCRHLVKDRMAITGARWGLEGGKAVLRLRALALNGDLDDYLEFHRGRERHRHHLSRYENHEIPRAAPPGPEEAPPQGGHVRNLGAREEPRPASGPSLTHLPGRRADGGAGAATYPSHKAHPQILQGTSPHVGFEGHGGPRLRAIRPARSTARTSALSIKPRMSA